MQVMNMYHLMSVVYNYPNHILITSHKVIDVRLKCQNLNICKQQSQYLKTQAWYSVFFDVLFAFGLHTVQLLITELGVIHTRSL